MRRRYQFHRLKITWYVFIYSLLKGKLRIQFIDGPAPNEWVFPSGVSDINYLLLARPGTDRPGLAQLLIKLGIERRKELGIDEGVQNGKKV